MKKIIALLTLSVALTGCVTSTKTEVTTTTQVAAAITRPTVQTLVVPLLTKHPEYEPALLALAAGADVVFSQGNVDVATLRGYVEALAAKYSIAEADKIVLTLGITNVYQFYVDTYQKPVMDATDPNVKILVAAFTKGIRDGITFYHAYQAAPATPAKGAPF